MKKFLLISVIMSLTTALSPAAVVGSDDASQAAYSSGWANGSNGGTTGAFGNWVLTSGGGSSGHFIGDSTNLAAGNNGADINSSGSSFGMYGHSEQTATAERSLASDLGIGQSFLIDLAVNWRNGNKGFAMKDSGSELFTLSVAGDKYTVSNVTTGGGDLFGGGGDLSYSSDTALAVILSQTSATGGDWSVVRSGGLTGTATGTYTGTPDRMRLYIINTSNNGESNLYANNISVIPEPYSVALVGAALLGIGIVRRRKS